MPRPIRNVDSAPRKLKCKKSLRTSASNNHANEDAIFYARSKFEQWVECYSGIYRYQLRPLVAVTGTFDEDAVFRADEFALVPTRDLYAYRGSIEEAREMLDHMEEQLDAAAEAREAEEG